MKKFYYSTVMMLAMVVAALSFVACSSDDDDSSATDSDLVGTWSLQYSEGWGSVDDDFEYMQLKADGTYIDVQEDEEEAKGYFVSHGKWSASDDKLYITITMGVLAGSTFTYDILEREKDQMTVSMWGVTAYLVRVSDSVIEKYLD